MKQISKHSIRISCAGIVMKTGTICVLSVIVAMQLYAMFSDNKGPNADASKEGATSAQAGNTPKIVKHSLPKTREQVKQELAELYDRQRQRVVEKSSKLPVRAALANPETYAMIQTDIMHSLDVPYGKLYRKLNLNNERLQMLRKLLADKEISLMEGYELCREMKIPIDSGTLNLLRNEPDNAIKDILGESAFNIYKDYERTVGARNHVDVLESRLSYKAQPLSNDQYEALVSELSKIDNPDIQSGRESWMGGARPQISRHTLAIARGLLAPQQYSIYEAEYERQKASIYVSVEYSKKFATEEKNYRQRIKAKLDNKETTP